ncbi:macrolide family glycosyltransferase [Streptomyces sp. NPDC057638]|uniref:macrolide family glycosyltransferase n=1 Tax=Streptomyces sp. NPDC057638 TaxID=3346190 RepID=UPI00369AC052
MSGRHLLVLPYPAYGHMMPALPVVAALVERGHRVTCFTTGEFEERVRATGATPRRYEPPPSSAPPPENVDADEAARSALRLLDASTAVLPSIEEGCDGVPDAVVYDTTLWLTGRLLAARWRRPSVQLSPTFVSNEHFSLAERMQRFSGPVDPGHPALAEFATRLGEAITGSGLREEQQAELFHGYQEFTVAFLPQRFQIAGDTFDGRHAFVGPALTDPTEPTAPAAWQPPEGGAPVLLVSLGTTVNHDAGFFQRCVRAFADLPWHTVLALGGRIDLADLGPLPPNVEAHRWVPLGAVLRHASVFLCQSGMGSIMAALAAGVPMVAVPHHPEQYVNAERLGELGLAEVVQREEATPEALRAAVARVAADDGIRDRIAAMCAEVRAAGGAHRAAEVIEDRLRSVIEEAA